MTGLQKVTFKFTSSLLSALIIYYLLSTIHYLPFHTPYSLLLTPYSLLPAFAQDPNYDRVNEIAKKLNCPTCAGLNLADCRTLTCEQWRNQINDLIEQGYGDEEVLNFFTARYGEQVLQEPPKSGWRLFLWMLPFVVLIVGGGWLLYAMRKWAGREVAPAIAAPSFSKSSSDPAPVPGNYLHQVEKDLKGEE
jgi:cytochrome c-type biogenesis protein CcmH